MKKLLYFVTAISLLGMQACSRMEEDTLDGTQQNAGPVLVQKDQKISITEASPFSKQKLDAAVVETMRSKGDFRFENEDLFLTWSALQYGDKSLAIGYKPARLGDIRPVIHDINIKTGEWKAVHDALIQYIVDAYKQSTGQAITWNEILIEDDAVLPILTIRLTDKNVLTALANLENVRYLEPLDYWPDQIERSSSGCDNSTTAISSSDFSTITPAARLPWNFNNINVPTAWNTSQGQGITIGVIDAGISSAQTLLGSQFQNGLSSGRTITTDYTFGTSAFTSCTHGTSMCGLAAGPRNDLNATTGVAYKSNLYFIRACNDVVLDGSSERTGVKNALVRMGNRSDVRIVSMSIGSPFYSSVLYDGVVYANNLGKLIFAAAGTSFSWTSWYGVVYPAYHSECVAVTGVKENSSTCASCHDGSQVDFTVPMERNTDSDRNTLSLKASGTAPAYIGGSSCATAITAGVAALVWSARPSLTKTQVFNALRNTSQYYPSVNGSRGYGNINASAAVAAGLAF
jgi:serine protease